MAAGPPSTSLTRHRISFGESPSLPAHPLASSHSLTDKVRFLTARIPRLLTAVHDSTDLAINEYNPAVATIEVEVQRDHLERLATSKSPIAAVTELVWNALDADAQRVEVELSRNQLGGLDEITVSDDGHGLPAQEAANAFSRLGGSWKMRKARTEGGRILHGQQGKGRFQAFALGEEVEWSTRYADSGTVYQYQIRGSRSSLKRFAMDEVAESRDPRTGTVVRIRGIDRKLAALESPRARQTLTEEFALYLREYSTVFIMYDGERLDPAEIEDHVEDYDIEAHLDDGRMVDAAMTVIEWAIHADRALYLCDENGFTLHQMPPGIQAPGFNFTAYLKSEFFRELWASGDLQLEDLHPDLKKVVDAAKDQLRSHFRRRVAEISGNLVERWKEEEVYPFEGTPRSSVEVAERQVFDVLALNVHEYLPDFRDSSVENRKLSFRLLRTAVETSPDAVQLILKDVLKLPKEKLEEFAELIEKTSLDAIINASKMVADRLDFLQGLEALVFSAEGKKSTLERRQLHRIVAEHTWLFGEEFNLTVNDRSLTSVLKRHLDMSERDLLDDERVVREDGTEGIIDLMLSRAVPQARPDQREHLIVEFKRPSVAIGSKEATQVKEYATAVATDERFRDTDTRWEFWAVSNEISEAVRLEASQAERPAGLLIDHRELRMRIWVKTWGQIIEACRARLHFFQEKLEYEATETSGLEYLRRVHEQYLPKALLKEPPPDAEDAGEKLL